MYLGRSDFKDKLLPNPEAEWFIDVSSFMLKGTKKAKYAIVTLQPQPNWGKTFASPSFAQNRELTASSEHYN